MVRDKRYVEAQREELPCEEEEQVEEDVQHVLGQHQRVQAVALVDRVLVVGLELVKRDDLREEDDGLRDMSAHDRT